MRLSDRLRELADSMPAAELAVHRRALAGGPWLWPAAATAETAWLADRVGLAKPETASRSWCVPLLSVGPGRADLWCFPAPPGVRGALAGLAPSAEHALGQACLAVQRLLPVLAVQRIKRLTEQPRALHLTSWGPADGVAGYPDDALSGGSYGLAFAVCAAAAGLQLPVPQDACFVGQLGEDGQVLDAELGEKIALVAECTGRIRRLFVADVLVERAQALLTGAGRTDIAVLGAATLGELLEAVFGGDLGRLPVVRAGQDPEARARVLRRLRHVVRAGSRVTLHWAPILACARAAAAAWADEPADRSAELRYLAAVASRHAGEPSDPLLPATAWWQALPPAQRAEVLANYVQHATDYGTVFPEVMTLVLGMDDAPETPEQARLLGARGRYRQLRFSQEEAGLRDLVASTQFWWDHSMFDDIAKPLSAAIRLSAALGHDATFERLANWAAELDEDNLLQPRDAAFVALALGTGHALRGQVDAAVEPLATAARGATGALACSALRWAAVVSRASGRASASAVAQLRTAGAEGRAHWYAAFAGLDEALHTNSAVDSALGEVVASRAHGLVQLLDGVPEAERARRVTRFWPY